MPHSRTTAQRRRESPEKTSLKSTWEAITAVPVDHFPLLLPQVHPIAAFFILRRLKGLGFSNCRVDSTRKGLVVYAQR